MNKIKPIIDHQLKKDLPEFSSGDSISVDVRVVEGGKERLQKFAENIKRNFWLMKLMLLE